LAYVSPISPIGIVTDGPYRFSKHPAYLAKNLTWWLISVPFISAAGPSEAVRMSLLLLLVNGIYLLRARKRGWPFPYAALSRACSTMRGREI
jgi:steroid 5-alpha reductase family enzyme